MCTLGWVHGDHFDQGAKTHDALRPFDELDRVDQLSTIVNLESERLAGRLADLAEPDRSATRLFNTEELEARPQVGWAGEQPGPVEPGTIDSWEADPETGDVTLIRVRWADGSVLEFDPFERLIRRA